MLAALFLLPAKSFCGERDHLAGIKSPPSAGSGRSDRPSSASTLIRIELLSQKEVFHYPEPIVFSANLLGENPIAGARVAADIKSPSGSIVHVTLREDLFFAGQAPGGGLYVGQFTDITEDGVYEIHVRADNGFGLARYDAGFGPESQKPFRVPTGAAIGEFRCDDLILVRARGYIGQPELPPLPVRNLTAEPSGPGCVKLSWMIPMNVGPDALYQVRCSTEMPPSEQEWQKAKILKKEAYRGTAGNTETIELCSIAPGAYLIAVQSIDRRGTVSGISNSYRIFIK